MRMLLKKKEKHDISLVRPKGFPHYKELKVEAILRVEMAKARTYLH